MNESFYRSFEDRYRGSRELIKSRLSAYVPFLKPLASLTQPAAAIDLGCGRGEWLELLTENGLNAYGVDLDTGMLAACHERGLHVEEADALETLRALPADSMALISAFHVVEHIPFDSVRSLIHEALRVLKPGGLLILETPNPENLVVGASDFYLDPTHERPIPPQLLGFAVEHAGFCRTKILRLQEDPDLHAAPEIGLLNVLNGVSPDYSVVAQKAAPVEILVEFDTPFQVEYGISLGTLARHYDMQVKNRLADLKNLLARAEVHATQSHLHMESRMARIEDRLAQSERKALEAEARAAQATENLNAMLLSRSWRITAPIRMASLVLRNGHGMVRRMIREPRLVIRRIVPATARLILPIVKRTPVLLTAARHIDRRYPALGNWLRRTVSPPSSAMPHDGALNAGMLAQEAPSAWGGDVSLSDQFKSMLAKELEQRKKDRR